MYPGSNVYFVLLSNFVDFIDMWCVTAYARECSTNTTKIMAGNCNITPNLALGNSNDILSGNTNATDRIDKFILIDKTIESNDE